MFKISLSTHKMSTLPFLRYYNCCWVFGLKIVVMFKISLSTYKMSTLPFCDIKTIVGYLDEDSCIVQD